MKRQSPLRGWLLMSTAIVLLVVLPLWLFVTLMGVSLAPSVSSGTIGVIDLSTYLNNTGVQSTDAPSPDFDGLYHGYLASALAVRGFVPGRAITVRGLAFKWAQPGALGHDNVVVTTQTITLPTPLSGPTLGILGAADGSLAAGKGRITYSDGSTQTFSLVQSDWTLNRGAAVVSTIDRVAAALPCAAPHICPSPRDYVFYQGIALKSGTPIASISLSGAVSGGRLHIFALSVGRSDEGHTSTDPEAIPGRGQWWGVNLSGAEFQDHAEPGTYGMDYAFPTAQEIAYFTGKGLRVLRVPVRWERLQDGLDGPLNLANVARLDSVVAVAAAHHAQVIVDLHNYGRYVLNGVSYPVGSPQVPQAALADLWRKLAAHYAGHAGIYGYDLMNEPSEPTWRQDAQAAVDAIRRVDRATIILVEGDTVGQPPRFTVTDPASHLLYSIHDYFDRANSGFYTPGESYDTDAVYPAIGVDRAQDVIAWLHAHHARAFYGEYGVPNTDPRWLTVLDLFLRYLSAHSDVIAGGTYWSAGPRWGAYPLSVEPSELDSPARRDKEQMRVLVRYPTTAR